MDDPYAALRHLEGRHVRLLVPEPTEDVDGRPLGVDLVDAGGGTLFLPEPPDSPQDAA